LPLNAVEQGNLEMSYQFNQAKIFQWKSLLHRATAPCNAEDAGGRGIFPALSFFPNLRYNDLGNEVTVQISIC